MKKWIAIGMGAFIALGVIVYNANTDNNEASQNDKKSEETEIYGPPTPTHLEDKPSDSMNEVEVETVNPDDDSNVEVRNNLAYDKSAETAAKEKYGEAGFNEAQQKAEQAMKLWVLNSVEQSAWLAVTTEQFYNDVVLKHNSVMEDTITREIATVDWIVSESAESDDVKFAFNVSFNVLAHGQVINKQQKLVYVTMKKGDNGWIATKIQMSA